MKKMILFIITLLVIAGGIGFAYKLGYLRKEEVKYVTFAYKDEIYSDYKCKIKDEKINCIVIEPTNGKDEFIGWCDSDDNIVDLEGDFSEGITLYPKFLTTEVAAEEKKTERKHIITFNMNGGVGSIDKIEVAYEGQLYKLNNLPKRSEYIFLGFYDNKDYKKGKQYYDENGESVRNYDKASNTTLYAGWKENKIIVETEQPEPTISKPTKQETKKNNYIIDYNGNGGSGSISSQTVESNKKVVIKSNTFTRSGYIFTGWKDGNGNSYNSGESIKIVSNITLYAQWVGCGSGTFSAGAKCSECAKGYYSTGSTNSNCTACPSGYTTSGMGSKSKESCYIMCNNNTRVTTVDGKCNGSCNSGATISSHIVYSGKTSPTCSTKEYKITAEANGGTIGIYGDQSGGATSNNNYAGFILYTNAIPGVEYTITMSSAKSTKGSATKFSTRCYDMTSDATLSRIDNFLGSNISYKITCPATANADHQLVIPIYYGLAGSTAGNHMTFKDIKITANMGWTDQSSTTTTKQVSAGKVYISLPVVVRPGYTLTGWNTHANGTGTKYNNNENINITSNTTLYAQWKKTSEEIKTYTITFNANGGSGNMASQKVNANIQTKINENIFKRDNHTFIGWNTQANGSGTKYNNNGNISITNNVTLYAQWQKNTTEAKKYTITFNANGGSGNMTSQIVTANIQTKINENIFKRDNYTFTGWKDGNGNSYVNGQTIIITNNITLYAQWRQNSTTPSNCTITFNGNGSTKGKMTSQTVKSNIDTTINSNLFSKDGNTFIGWNTNADGSGNAYSNNGSINITSNITLYAQWKANNYTVTFDKNGGSGSVPKSVTATFGKKMPIIDNNIPTKSGYAFNGWYNLADCTNGDAHIYYNIDGSSARNYDKIGNLTLYAGWIKIQETSASTYKITFDLNGGTGTKPNDINNIKYNEKLNQLTTPSPTRNEYIFMGWYNHNDFKNGMQYYDANGNSTRNYDVKSDTKLYAGWMSTNTFIVKYDCNGGQNAPASQYIKNGEMFIPAVNTCKNKGNNFDGWYDNSGKEWTLNVVKSINLQNDNKNVINNTLKLKAKWFSLGKGEPIVPTTIVDKDGNTINVTYDGRLCDSDISKDPMEINMENNKYCKFEAENDTLKYYIVKESGYIITFVWVKDVNKQLKVAIAEVDDKPSTEKIEERNGTKLILKEQVGRDIIQQEIAANEYENLGLYGVNASGMINQSFTPGSPKGWRGQPSVNYFKNKGNEIRNGGYYMKVHYGLTKDGYLKAYPLTRPTEWGKKWSTGEYREAYNQKKELVKSYINNVDGVESVFGFGPVLVRQGVSQKNADKENDVYSKDLVAGWDDKAKRQSICQIDKNNFIFITATSTDKLSYTKMANMMVGMGCKTGLNLDGGGSTSVFYKGKSNRLSGPLKGHDGRISGDILYFVEQK